METPVVPLAAEEVGVPAEAAGMPVAPAASRAAGSEENRDDPMASVEERMAILRMIEQGKISAEEGARLLAALGGRQGQAAPPPPEGFDTSRGLRIRVYDLLKQQPKVNVTLPVGLVRLGLRLVPPSAEVDLAQIQQAIDSGVVGRILEVVDHEHNTRVEITLE
jgi:hypothetical protein